MRVAFHVDQLWFKAPGGIGTYVEQLLLRFLASEEVELIPFSSRWRRAPSFTPFTTDGRFPGVELPISIRLLYPAWDYLRRPYLPGELAIAEVVHATNPAAIPPVRSTQKLVVTVHDLTFERYPELYPPRWLRLYRRGLRIAAAEASAIVVPSQHVRDEVIAFTGIERARCHVTPLASAMREPDEAARADRDDHGISPPYVLAVGTVEPRKNLARLVRVFRRLAEEGFPHALVIVGPEGRGSDELREEIDRGGAGRIVQAFLGEDALAAAYADADAVAYVSLYEGFGLPVLEAMSMGAAVVGSNVSAIPEIAGDAALLVDPTDEDAIADALRQVLTEPGLRGDLSRRGLERAAGFSWEATARATLDVYREVLA